MESGWMTEMSLMGLHGDAAGECHDYVTPGVDADGAIGESREAAQGRFDGRGDARPVHYTAQNPLEDIMAQRGLGIASRGFVDTP
jgi:hypothetical protein